MNEFKEGWGTLVAAVIGTLCGLITITNYTQGFFVGPVTQEFGWTPPQFFLGFTVMMCAGLLTAPLVGSLAEKIGLKKIGMLGLVGHALGYFLISINNGNFIFWLLSWAFLSILAASSLPIIWTAALNGYFKQHRGKAIGITMAGTGIGAFILPPLVESIISDYGWRAAYQAIGVGALAISLPIVFFLFKQKEGEEVDKGNSVSAGWGVTRKEAMRTTKFWILSAVLFSTVIVVVGLLSNFERIMGAEGLDRPTIAGIASIMGITVIFGRLAVGVLVDRFWAPGVACVFFCIACYWYVSTARRRCELYHCGVRCDMYWSSGRRGARYDGVSNRALFWSPTLCRDLWWHLCGVYRRRWNSSGYFWWLGRKYWKLRFNLSRFHWSVCSINGVVFDDG